MTDKKEFNLSEKRVFDNYLGIYQFDEGDVKEKIQNAERRISKEVLNDLNLYALIGKRKVVEIIDKIFKEEFGDKLTK